MRIARWTFLLVALASSVTWSYVSINHLLASSMSPQQRTADYDSKAEAARVHQMDLAQQHWGRHTMFALAFSFFFLLASMMNWVLDGRQQRPANLNQLN